MSITYNEDGGSPESRVSGTEKDPTISQDAENGLRFENSPGSQGRTLVLKKN